MKIGPFNINLAVGAKPSVDQTEIGTGNVQPNFFRGETIDLRKVLPKDYINMRENDGTVQSLYSILTMPILANPWDIEPDEDEANVSEAAKQAKFVKDVFTLPDYKGGMSTPFGLVLADMLRAILEGYRVYEKVWGLNPQGQIIYAKIAPRDNQTVRILEDDRGGFNGIKQWAYIGDKFEIVTIPKDKCFLFTYNKEKEWLHGESAFRAAYYHYDKKHRLYYLANQAAQQFAIPPKVGIAPAGAKQGVIDAITESLSKMDTNPSMTLPNGATASTLSAGAAMDLIPLIDHHNAEMARSVLAHFILLGTGSKTGSFALSQDQSDMFVLALHGLMHIVEDHINSYLIPDLIDYNFANPIYPTFEFDDITDATRDIAKEAFMTLIKYLPSGVPDWLVTGVAEKMAETLDVEKPYGASDEGTFAPSKGVAVDPNHPDNAPADGPIPDPNAKPDKGVPKPTPGKKPDTGGDTSVTAPVKQSDSRKKKIELALPPMNRQLTQAEGKVNFAAIQNKFDNLDQDYAAATAPLWATIKADAIKKLRKLLEAKDYKALETFGFGYEDAYVAQIVKAMMDAYVFAKNGAADEIGRAIPANSTATKIAIQQKAKAVADKQYNDLEFQIRNLVTEAIRKNKLSESVQLSVGDVLSEAGALMATYYTDNVLVGATAFIAQSINWGRADVFSTYKNSVQSYQYSAVLDRSTCEICADLDGTVVDEAEYASTQWQPPIHFNCRCIWVAIMNNEIEPPFITGFPDSPGGVDEPLLHEVYGNSIKLSVHSKQEKS